MPLSHTWMRNIHWTNMKEKYICPVHPVKRGLCLIILFLILGICFLSARAATGEISDHTGDLQEKLNQLQNELDPLPHPTNSNCNPNDWSQIHTLLVVILIVVVLIFIISAINLSINYKHEYCENHRKQHDPEAGPRLEEHRPLLEEHSDLQETMIELRIQNGDLQEKLNQLQNELDQLKSENSQLKSENKKLQHENEWRKARNKTDNITLDAGTAHPNLSIAGDKKNFKHEAQPQQVPPNPQRFDSTVCVLGSEGFSSGEHYWEVDVGSSIDWDLGVARKSIQRKGKLSLSPKEGFWALGLSGRDYWAKTDPWTRVMVQKKPKKIGVYLSYQDRQVTFFNVTDMSVLFTFNDCSFSGVVYPFFKNSHKETSMRLCSIREDE